MSLSAPFIRRPVATTLLTVAITLVGAISFFLLPVSPLPEVEFPTIQVSANLPGASPETMASAVATPLERQFGRIAGVTEMSSASSLGATSVTLQFDLSRNIDSAARDVQAAINAARGQLPANLPDNPTYRKVNPADSPIMILALTSALYTKPQMYDAAQTILQQKLSQVEGVGQVSVGGGSPPAVRVEVNPTLLNHFGLGLDDVRATLAAANSNRPVGELSDGRYTWALATRNQLFKAAEYEPLIVSYRSGAAVRLKDVAKVTDSVENVRASGLANGQPSVLVIIFRQPGANIISTVDQVRAMLPQLRAEIPAAVNLDVVMDRTATIRASVKEVEFSLVLSIVLVVLVIFAFLRDWRATIIPSVVVPVSLVATFAVMYLAGYSIDNLSLMALTIATGFVVDDAIVVIENIARHIEDGMTPLEASFRGAREIGFTVLSISVSLVAVFIPILLMQGIVGRLFREFAVTLSVAILISMVVSLTTTPMMCAKLLKPAHGAKHGLLYRATEALFEGILYLYRISLQAVLRHQPLTLLVFFATMGLTVYLYFIVPKGFFPQQDTGRLIGSIQADQDTSYRSMERLMERFAVAVADDPAVAGVTAFTGGQGGGSVNSGRMFVALKPPEVRGVTSDQLMARLRRKLSSIPGATLFLQPTQDLRIGGRASSSQFQFVLQGDNLADLSEWGQKVLQKLRTTPGLVDVNSDQQNRGLQASLVVDRNAAARLGISPQSIDDTLYSAFGQRQVSTIFTPLSQYRVVMGVEEQFASSPESLEHIYLKGAGGKQVPLSAIARFGNEATALSVNHSGLFPSIAISFNLTPGTALGEAVERIRAAEAELRMPPTIRTSFSGAAQAFQSSLASQPLLILAALVTVYIVLGMLYESYIHPITILSTLPSAGMGALIALLLFNVELSVMALIGIILLIGIVKKNAIMMIDFALDAERNSGMSPERAIYEACVMRFRPITMTTMAALLGAIPLAFGAGTGSELRRPLGLAIVGGLIVSQMLTLYTTPVVYLYLDRARLRFAALARRGTAPAHRAPGGLVPAGHGAS